MKLAERMNRIDYSPIRKYHPYAVEAKKQGKKIYHFNIGQPDVITPEVFMECVRGYHEPVLEYMPSQGIPELIHAVRDYYKRYNMNFNEEDIFITNGGSEALCFIFASILNDGDEVLVPEPFYTNYQIFTSYFEGNIVPIPSHAEEGYHYASREKIEKEITSKTKVILINSPCNPTGNVLTGQEMEMILQVAKEHGLYVITDEVYREFVYDGEPLSSFGQHMDGFEDHLIIVDSISKRFSACGARIGTILTKNAEIKNAVLKLAQARLSVPTLEQFGAASLYQLTDEYFNQVRDEYQRRRDIVFQEIMKIPDVICDKPKGSFYITVKLPIDNAHDFQIFMLTEFEDRGETIMFAPVEGFYATPGRGRKEIRIAYVLKEESLIRGMELLRLGLAAYIKKQQNQR
jgi:aspartate aminotransferase